MNCIECHPGFKLGGTIFTDDDGSLQEPGASLVLLASDGAQTILNHSDANGNIHETFLADGDYLIRVGNVRSRTWHNLPRQRSCNECHIPGGNGPESRSLVLPANHTQVTPDNRCTDCHHYPATMNYGMLNTGSVLNITAFIPEIPGSRVIIDGQTYMFDPEEYAITTSRPDIFATGYFSMFDVILAIAGRNNIPVEYSFDSTRMTHFITSLDSISGEYWYRFSYDTGGRNSNELANKRENRWDETLWRPGVWIRVVDNEPLEDIRAEYLEEIERETEFGHMIPRVRIRLNPSVYEGNPPESNRITVTKLFENLIVTAHNFRSASVDSPYSKPFQPGVVTSMDIPLSLVDQDSLTVTTGAFYTYFAGKYIDSYYIVEMGFPEEGTAHASGRQGFTYATGNGPVFSLAHGADNTFHITADIAVLHAPDFSTWRWTELGNPYYEIDSTLLNRSIYEDHDATGRGFNLHRPYPNPLKNEDLQISFNIFEPGMVRLEIFDSRGKIMEILYDSQTANLGIHRLSWKTGGVPAGQYYIRMIYNNHQQVRRITIVK